MSEGPADRRTGDKGTHPEGRAPAAIGKGDPVRVDDADQSDPPWVRLGVPTANDWRRFHRLLASQYETLRLCVQFSTAQVAKRRTYFFKRARRLTVLFGEQARNGQSFAHFRRSV